MKELSQEELSKLKITLYIKKHIEGILEKTNPYLISKLNTWDEEQKYQYVFAYENGEWDTVNQMTRDLDKWTSYSQTLMRWELYNNLFQMFLEQSILNKKGGTNGGN
ncbi:MAG: hypothetical protein WC554_13715 [Clostridia bacterium]|jgi:hypothetical protein